MFTEKKNDKKRITNLIMSITRMAKQIANLEIILLSLIELFRYIHSQILSYLFGQTI